MVNIHLDDSQVKAFFRALRTDLKEIVLQPMYRAADYIRGVAQKQYLRGPRPTHLQTDTGNLWKGVRAEARIESGQAVGIIQARAESKQGFDYAAYWELSGSRHGGPRQFLAPARDEHEDEWMQIFNRVFAERFNKWQSAKTF